MNKLTAPLLIAALTLAGCGGRFSDSGWNPLAWGSGGSRGPSTLEPEGGYEASGDLRPAIAQITSARWEPLNEGRLLVVTGLAPTKGYSSVALITTRAQPSGRISPDADGVLRLRLVGVPPLPESPQARMAANPVTDTITASMSLSHIQLAPISAVEITGASNVVTIRR
ncbi:hypothetical protein H4P12_04430 [Paracoccus sp. 11-3]|uniref:Lipoprotein n=1 Tax=Paracoccus amoyensis TaxID=2760093 RepID=A0A926G9U0_9RHOB|nr:hypothetical protein [Paracoccus amoyensis]MBC9245976.1 hypothetical protein [Paracoccus amoyensis]